MYDVMGRSLGAHQVNSKVIFGKISQLMSDKELDTSIYDKDKNLATEASAFIKSIMKDLPKINPFPRPLVLKKEVIKRLMASKDGSLDLMSAVLHIVCLLYTSPSPRDQRGSRMPSSA